MFFTELRWWVTVANGSRKKNRALRGALADSVGLWDGDLLTEEEQGDVLGLHHIKQDKGFPGSLASKALVQQLCYAGLGRGVEGLSDVYFEKQHGFLPFYHFLQQTSQEGSGLESRPSFGRVLGSLWRGKWRDAAEENL